MFRFGRKWRRMEKKIDRKCVGRWVLIIDLIKGKHKARSSSGKKKVGRRCKLIERERIEIENREDETKIR